MKPQSSSRLEQCKVAQRRYSIGLQLFEFVDTEREIYRLLATANSNAKTEACSIGCSSSVRKHIGILRLEGHECRSYCLVVKTNVCKSIKVQLISYSHVVLCVSE